MRLPKKLVICGHEVAVKYKKGLIVDGKECWGVWEQDKNIIYLRAGMEKSRKQEIVLHEMLHACSDIHLLNLTEKQVKILGIELLAFIRNNRININGK